MTTAIALAVYGLLLLAGAIAVWRRPIVSIYVWIVGVAVHNTVGAALYGAGVRGGALTAIQAWKEILLAVALARVVVDAVRARTLPFRPGVVDALALAYGALVCVYALIPQHVLGGSADGHAVGLALKHNLIPVGAYFLGRAVVAGREDLARLAWTIVGAAVVVAALGLIDVYAISISWWRDSAVVPYFNKHLGYDYHGTGGLPENFIYNVGGDKPFLRRLVSVFLSPLATAYMLTVALLLAAAFRRRVHLLAAAAVVLAAGLLFTFSRSSLVALAAGLVVLAFAQRRWWAVLAAAITIGVSVAWVHVFPHIAPTGRFTKADIAYQHRTAKKQPGGTFNPISPNEPSFRNHLTSLRDGAHTVLHHPQGFGLGNAGQTASRTETPIKAGESNYTEMGAEMGILGSVLWTAWVVALFLALLSTARRTGWWAAVGVAAAFGAALALAVQTDVIGDPWMGYVLWSLVGLVLAADARSALGSTADDLQARGGRGGRRRRSRSVRPLPGHVEVRR
jgi:O-Antigen ligase